MGWSSLTLVLDADLGVLEPEATASDAPWGNVTWPNQRAEAKRDVRIWIERDYGFGMSDRVLDQYRPDQVFGYTSSAYTDYTPEASNEDEEDVDLAAVFATFGTDRLYVGFAAESDGLQVKMLDSFNAIASTLTAKYSGPSGWTSLSAVDGTSASSKAFAKSGRVRWAIPTDWQRRTLNGSDALFWVELSVSAALTSGTSATQITVVRAHDGLKRVAALRAMGYIMKGVAAQAVTPANWLLRVNNHERTGYWDLADALYASLRDSSTGIPMDLNNDEVIDPGSEEQGVSHPLIIGRA